MLEIQRRAFEQQFGSLESMGYEDQTKLVREDESTSQSESESDSEGDGRGESESDPDSASETEQSGSDDNGESSEDEQLAAPRVIKFNGPSDDYVPPSRKEQQRLRSGRSLRSTSAGAVAPADVPDDEDDHFENDLALQRLLQESHLLSALGTPDLDSAPQGKARARTLETRLRALSAANGRDQLRLEKVPMQVRKGMVDKHVRRIAQHEHDAREAGVVLPAVKRGEFRRIDRTFRTDIERRIGSGPRKKAAAAAKRRQRGLRVQTVGRSTRHGLRISAADAARLGGKRSR